MYTPEPRTESYTFCYYAEEGIKREVASSWSGHRRRSILPASSHASPFVSLPLVRSLVSFLSVTQR